MNLYNYIYILSALLLFSLIGFGLAIGKAKRKSKGFANQNAVLEAQLEQLRSEMMNVLNEKTALAERLFLSGEQEKSLKEALTQLSNEKVIFSTDLDEAWKLYTALKSKYDALYLKNIDITNERNRLKQQLAAR